MPDKNKSTPAGECLRQAKAGLELSLEAMINDELRLFVEATGVEVKRLNINFAYKGAERKSWVIAELDI